LLRYISTVRENQASGTCTLASGETPRRRQAQGNAHQELDIWGSVPEKLVRVKYPSNKYDKALAQTVPMGYRNRASEMGQKSVDSV